MLTADYGILNSGLSAKQRAEFTDYFSFAPAYQEAWSWHVQEDSEDEFDGANPTRESDA